MNERSDKDFPVLTDVISDHALPQRTADELHRDNAHAGLMQDALPEHHGLPDLQQIQDTLSDHLIAELSLQLPVLVEAALREHLPQAMGARLQAELLNALTNALPAVAQAAAGELSARVAYEVGGLLEQRMQEGVRRAVADEIARLTGQA